MTTEIQKSESGTDPWSDLDRAFDELRGRASNVWGISLFGEPFAAIERSGSGLFRAARTDVTDTGASYKVVAEVPGIPKEKLDIRVKGTSLEIRGESESTKNGKDAEFVHRERTYAGYYRHLEFPEAVVAAEAKAKVENGVLELELPKEHPAPSKAEVKVPVA
jgi:HSP20 family protein